MEHKVTNQFITKISSYAYSKGLDNMKVFEMWIDYVMHGITINAEVKKDWHDKKNQLDFFLEMFNDWLQHMNKKVSHTNLWYDLLGEVYMELVSKSKASYTGQFFTPMHICDFMQHITAGEEKIKGINVSDPCCGSGRNLLSFHANNIGNYVFGMDIDVLCCKMTVLNFWIHGCIGEVLCINTLTMQNFNGCWQTSITPDGVPFVQIIEEKDSKQLHRYSKLNSVTTQNKQSRQLQLF